MSPSDDEETDSPPGPASTGGKIVYYLLALFILGCGLVAGFFAALPVMDFLVSSSTGSLQLGMGLVILIIFGPIAGLLFRTAYILVMQTHGRQTGPLVPWQLAAVIFGVVSIPIVAVLVINPTALLETNSRVGSALGGLLSFVLMTVALRRHQTDGEDGA